VTELLAPVDRGLQHLALGCEPEAVIDELAYFGISSSFKCMAPRSSVIDSIAAGVRGQQDGATRRLVHASATSCRRSGFARSSRPMPWRGRLVQFREAAPPARASCRRSPPRRRARKVDRDVGALSGALSGIGCAAVDVVGHFPRGILQHFSSDEACSRFGGRPKRSVAALVLGVGSGAFSANSMSLVREVRSHSRTADHLQSGLSA